MFLECALEFLINCVVLTIRIVWSEWSSVGFGLKIGSKWIKNQISIEYHTIYLIKMSFFFRLSYIWQELEECVIIWSQLTRPFNAYEWKRLMYKSVNYEVLAFLPVLRRTPLHQLCYKQIYFMKHKLKAAVE